MEEWYSVQEIADELSVTTRTVRNYLKSGQLKGQKAGGQWRFTKKDIHDFLSQHSNNEMSEPELAFLSGETRFNAAMMSFYIQRDSWEQLEHTQKQILNYYHLVYEDSNKERELYYQVVSLNTARLTIIGHPDYVLNFGEWIHNQLREK